MELSGGDNYTNLSAQLQSHYFSLFTVAIAVLVGSYLDLLISLVGSLASAALALIFPPLFEILTYWPERHNNKKFWLMFIKNLFLAFVGFTGFIAGTTVTIIKLVEKLSAHSQEGSCPT